MGKITSFREPGSRYTALRVIGLLCTLSGVILMAIGGWLLSLGLYTVANNAGAVAPPLNPAPFGGPRAETAPWLVFGGFSVLWSLGILFSGMQLIALGAFLRLMIHVEENTRVSAQALDRIRTRLEANPEGVEPIFRP